MFRQGPDFSLRDKRLFELNEFEIARVNCIYFSQKICFVDITCRNENLTTAKNIVEKRRNCSEQFLFFSTILFLNISLNSRVQLHIYLLHVVVQIILA